MIVVFSPCFCRNPKQNENNKKIASLNYLDYTKVLSKHTLPRVSSNGTVVRDLTTALKAVSCPTDVLNVVNPTNPVMAQNLETKRPNAATAAAATRLISTCALQTLEIKTKLSRIQSQTALRLIPTGLPLTHHLKLIPVSKNQRNSLIRLRTPAPSAPNIAAPTPSQPSASSPLDNLKPLLELLNLPLLKCILNTLPELAKIISNQDSWSNKIFQIIGIISNVLNNVASQP